VEVVFVVDLLKKAAGYMQESVDEYCFKTTMMDEVEHLRGQNAMLRALITVEDGDVDLGELGEDDGKAA